MEVQELERLIRQQEVADTNVFSALMRKVYVWMTLALVITGVTAVGVANSPNLLALIYGNSFTMWGLIIAELGLVMYISARIEKLSLSTATILFAVYSALNGAMLSSIFLLYTTAVISKVFFITAATFGVISGQHTVHGPYRTHHSNRCEHVHEEQYVRADTELHRCGHIRRTYRMGQPENQGDADGTAQRRRGRTESSPARCPVTLFRLHQPLPLPAEDFWPQR